MMSLLKADNTIPSAPAHRLKEKRKTFQVFDKLKAKPDLKGFYIGQL